MPLFRLLMLLTGVAICSCYYFPFMITGIPFVNSKMALAVLGIVMLLILEIKNHRTNSPLFKDFLILTVWSFLISIIAFIAVNLSHSLDRTFFLYFMSMWVWTSAAYAMVMIIKVIHGSLGVRLVVNYIVAVCVCQCILALFFNTFPAMENWSATTFAGEAYMGAETGSRLHGIGCALDVAGLRFSAALLMAAFFIVYAHGQGYTTYAWIMIIAFCFIVVIGSQISRTTSIGAIISLVYIVCASMFKYKDFNVLKKLFKIILITIPIIIFLFHTNESFEKNFRFGFEGFFSLVEKGHWETTSNNILENMVVWPDNLKTWLIGDGYADNPTNPESKYFDPYYIGPSFTGFYMDTDIGYCRYIFYFGIIGLAAFIAYFCKTCQVLCRRFPSYTWMFVLILLMNFVGWTKVSTDLFIAFAPFLCISREEDEEYNDMAYFLGRFKLYE